MKTAIKPPGRLKEGEMPTPDQGTGTHHDHIRSVDSTDTTDIKIVNDAIRVVVGAGYLVAKPCIRCGRLLSAERSRARGIGDRCAERMGFGRRSSALVEEDLGTYEGILSPAHADAEGGGAR